MSIARRRGGVAEVRLGLPPPHPSPYREMRVDVASLRRRFLAAQLIGDRREAVRLVVEEGLGAGVAPLDLELDVVAETQREIGRMWAAGEIPVGDEHMSTLVAVAALHAMAERTKAVPSVGRTVLVACVAGELHELPARLVADALELGGYRVLFTGASTPTPSLVEMAGRGVCDLLALSATIEFNIPALRKAVNAVREKSLRLPIVVGGQAVTPETFTVGRQVQATGGTARTIVAVADRLLDVSR